VVEVDKVDTVAEVAMVEVINKMEEIKEITGTTESQRIITVSHIIPHLASTLKKLQIYQSILLQFRKTFMLSMKQLPKDRRKKTINL